MAVLTVDVITPDGASEEEVVREARRLMREHLELEMELVFSEEVQLD